jgi:hypothetical protein
MGVGLIMVWSSSQPMKFSFESRGWEHQHGNTWVTNESCYMLRKVFSHFSNSLLLKATSKFNCEVCWLECYLYTHLVEWFILGYSTQHACSLQLFVSRERDNKFQVLILVWFSSQSGTFNIESCGWEHQYRNTWAATVTYFWVYKLVPKAEKCYEPNKQFFVPSESKKQVPMMGASTWNYVGNNCDIFSGWC